MLEVRCLFFFLQGRGFAFWGAAFGVDYGVGAFLDFPFLLHWIPIYSALLRSSWITFLVPLLHPKLEPKLTPSQQVQTETETATPLPHQLLPLAGWSCPTVSRTQTRC